MSDRGAPNKTDSLRYLMQQAVGFSDEREWKQFHSPKNCAANLAVEASELLECYLWNETATSREAIADEAADVLHALLVYCDSENIDLSAAFIAKLAKTAAKYPIETSKGNNAKYTELP
ncbi:MAG TPA: nucleotide pyrophosphohydrolase [Candidatus Saccharimonadales bacterium]|nr:nucleotide pyrophosphohydrolase [Candidatus Saccharimonadales bacterium]